MHTIEARIELVLLALVAILEQQFALPASLPERAVLLCYNWQGLWV
jgi:hypothetical protein